MTITQDTELLALQLMFGDYQKRNLAYAALQRRGVDKHLLTNLNRKGEFKTGLVLENFEYVQNKNLLQCPSCDSSSKQTYKESVFKATANTVVADVKSFFNYAKVKAIIITGYIGLPSKATDKLDSIGANVNVRITKNEITPSGSMMFLSAGAQINENGNTNTVLGMAGLAETDPNTGSFDLSVPTGAGRVVNLGHNMQTNDTNIGVGAAIKKIFELSVNAVFNFQENARGSKRIRQQADQNLEKAMRMENEW